jgi:inner membrane protein YidH
MANPSHKLDVNTELAARRTGMSFQRTRLAKDRTLMAAIRTSLSLIGFGFTIYQFFQRLREQDIITRVAAPRHFGFALVALGVVMLFFGIAYHVQFMLCLRPCGSQCARKGLFTARLSSSVAYPDYGVPPVGDRRRGDCEHGVPSRAIRLRGGVITVRPIGSLVPRQNFRRGSSSNSLSTQERKNAQNGQAEHSRPLG